MNIFFCNFFTSHRLIITLINVVCLFYCLQEDCYILLRSDGLCASVYHVCVCAWGWVDQDSQRREVLKDVKVLKMLEALGARSSEAKCFRILKF